MKSRGLMVIFPLLAMLACTPQARPYATPDAMPDATLREEVRLYVFDCGRIRLGSVEMFGIAAEETDVRELAVPCYVVEHARGRLLWDGGLPSSYAVSETGRQGEGGPLTLERTLAAQLADMGLDMGSFDYVAFSHMHLDHVGVANELRGGTLLIQQAEYDAAFADVVTVPGYNPELYRGLRDLDVRIIVGDHDVFGDGRVRIISAPGHTPGHQVLFIDLAETGSVVLSGDLYHFRFSLEQKRVPPFNTDREQTLASMRRIDRLLDETGAELWIEHELAHFMRLRKAPAYYR
jgi:N-acyl homoserine lactone hydrolase